MYFYKATLCNTQQLKIKCDCITGSVWVLSVILCVSLGTFVLVCVCVCFMLISVLAPQSHTLV